MKHFSVAHFLWVFSQVVLKLICVAIKIEIYGAVVRFIVSEQNGQPYGTGFNWRFSIYISFFFTFLSN